jgi:hypothetical protein
MVLVAAGAGFFWAIAGIGSPAVAKTCGYSWAKPGTYRISGNFRGATESASAKLTHDCRVVLNIPGVFSGGSARRSGGCLKFFFKVQGEKKTFSARWCNTYGLVPWKGRTIRAKVTRLKLEPPPRRVIRNYNK